MSGRQWSPAERGVHPVVGGGPLPRTSAGRMMSVCG
jgi:hypothetical protein